MILYFSGTGNSRFAAQQLAAALGEQAQSISPWLKTNTVKSLHSETPLVFVSPTHAWRMPRAVEQWIASTPFSGHPDAYFLLTCGSDVGNAAAFCKALCAKKGLRFRGLFPVVMPENYIAMFPVPDQAEANRLLQAARPEFARAAALIRAGESFPPIRPTVLDRLKSGPVNPLFYRFAVRSRPFFATDACTGCGTCQALCPKAVITLEQNRPRWNPTGCIHCMACICACPAAAIEYGKQSQGKPRYYLPAAGGALDT